MLAQVVIFGGELDQRTELLLVGGIKPLCRIEGERIV